MSDFRDSARRWTGGVLLGVAVLMVVLGLTVFESQLKTKAASYILYWMICFAFTVSAATIALLDASAVRRAAVREQRDLIEKTIAETEQDRENSHHGRKRNQA